MVLRGDTGQLLGYRRARRRDEEDDDEDAENRAEE